MGIGSFLGAALGVPSLPFTGPLGPVLTSVVGGLAQKGIIAGVNTARNKIQEKRLGKEQSEISGEKEEKEEKHRQNDELEESQVKEDSKKVKDLAKKVESESHVDKQIKESIKGDKVVEIQGILPEGDKIQGIFAELEEVMKQLPKQNQKELNESVKSLRKAIDKHRGLASDGKAPEQQIDKGKGLEGR